MLQSELEQKMKTELHDYYVPFSHCEEDFPLLHLGAEFGVRWAIENKLNIKTVTPDIIVAERDTYNPKP